MQIILKYLLVFQNTQRQHTNNTKYLQTRSKEHKNKKLESKTEINNKHWTNIKQNNTGIAGKVMFSKQTDTKPKKKRERQQTKHKNNN